MICAREMVISGSSLPHSWSWPPHWWLPPWITAIRSVSVTRSIAGGTGQREPDYVFGLFICVVVCLFIPERVPQRKRVRAQHGWRMLAGGVILLGGIPGLADRLAGPRERCILKYYLCSVPLVIWLVYFMHNKKFVAEYTHLLQTHCSSNSRLIT